MTPLSTHLRGMRSLAGGCILKPAGVLLLSTSSVLLCGCTEPAGSLTEPVAASAPTSASAPTESAPAAAPANVSEPAASEFQYVAPALTADELRAGWISLFDGSSLFGWDVPTVSNWHVADGCIVVDSGEKSLLLTPFRLDDFEFRCDFHVAQGGNSGVFLRTAETVTDPATDTYELNICDSHPTHKTGSLVARHAAQNVPAVEGAWHTFRVLCEGPRLQVWLDEKPIVDFTDSSSAVLLSGRLGLQMNAGRAAFRNVYLRPINGRELFDGQTTEGWRLVPGSKSRFDVVDKALHVTNGPGFLETTDIFGNFILHVEARTNGEALNSGIFFRAMPGTEAAPSHGYEMQIQNGFRNNDRRQPADFGTGAIFRRVPARYVVASDREWFTQTLIAQDDRFASWVNGFQVVNWQDTRPADQNPRQGKRLEPGHLSLQGHDPTTDLDFRSIRIHPLRSAP